MDFGKNAPPIGTIIPYAGSIDDTKVEELKNAGWLLCLGDVLKIADFESLYPIIGVNYGGSADSFNVPDFRGKFLRGYSGDSNLDPDKNDRISYSPSSSSGNKVGSLQTFATARPKNPFKLSEERHHHTSKYLSSADVELDSGFSHKGLRVYSRKIADTSEVADHSHYSLPKTGDVETRPNNVAMHYLIKFKDSANSGNYIPEGSIIMYCSAISGDMAAALAPHWLPVLGQSLPNAEQNYPILWRGTTGNMILQKGTAIQLPDLRGRFLRTCMSDEFAGQLHDFKTGLPKTKPMLFNETGEHTHTFMSGTRCTSGALYGSERLFMLSNGAQTTQEHRHEHVVTGGGDKETRPINITVDFLIRVSNPA